MRMLLAFLQSPNVDVIIASLRLLHRLIQSAAMQDYWVQFLELIMLKFIHCYSNGKEVHSETQLHSQYVLTIA